MYTALGLNFEPLLNFIKYIKIFETLHKYPYKII